MVPWLVEHQQCQMANSEPACSVWPGPSPPTSSVSSGGDDIPEMFRRCFTPVTIHLWFSLLSNQGRSVLVFCFRRRGLYVALLDAGFVGLSGTCVVCCCLHRFFYILHTPYPTTSPVHPESVLSGTCKISKSTPKLVQKQHGIYN